MIIHFLTVVCLKLTVTSSTGWRRATEERVAGKSTKPGPGGSGRLLETLFGLFGGRGRLHEGQVPEKAGRAAAQGEPDDG